MPESKTIDIEKYAEALNNLIGVDSAYLKGDKDVDAIVEVITLAKKFEGIISQQYSEIVRLKDLCECSKVSKEIAKSEAIEEFAEELKTRIKNAVFCCYDLRFKPHLQELLNIIVAKIDNLVKEKC